METRNQMSQPPHLAPSHPAHPRHQCNSHPPLLSPDPGGEGGGASVHRSKVPPHVITRRASPRELLLGHSGLEAVWQVHIFRLRTGLWVIRIRVADIRCSG